MAELIKYFSSREAFSVSLILFGIKRDIFYDLPADVVVHRPSFKFGQNFRWFFSIRTMFFLRNVIKSINPDVCLSFGEYWNNFVLLSTYGLKLPIYVSDRCQPDKSLGFLHDTLRKNLYPRAKGIIAQTNYAKEKYARYFYHPNIIVIGNPVRHIQSSISVTRNKVVLTVGRLIYTKHHDKLIESFLRVHKEGWKLVIIGGDAQKQSNAERLTQLIHNLNVEDKVILLGNREDVDSFYLTSEIFAFTSSSEGFPNVIAEAQSAGLPVVCFDCIAGPSEMVEDGFNGFLVPLFDYKEFESRLEKLMDDEELRLLFRTRAQVSIQKFSIETIGAAYELFLTSND